MMDIFAQKKMLLRIIVALILLNIGLVFLLFKNANKHEPLLFPKKEAFKDVAGILKKELQLSNEQALQIQQLRDSFYAQEQTMERCNKSQKDSMNEAIFSNNTNDTTVMRLAKSISNNGYQREILRYSQAKALKAICTSRQRAHLFAIVKEVRDYFRPDNQPIKK